MNETQDKIYFFNFHLLNQAEVFSEILYLETTCTCMSGFMKMGLKNWTPNLDFNELLGLL